MNIDEKLLHSLENWQHIIKYEPIICENVQESEQIIGIKYTNDIIYCNIVKKYMLPSQKLPPTGSYTYILTMGENGVILRLIESMPSEIGSKHFCVLRNVTEKEKIISAGEIAIESNKVFFNFLSGSIMIDIEASLMITYKMSIQKVREDILIPLHKEILERMFPKYNISYTENRLLNKIEISKKFLDKLCKEKDMLTKVRLFRNMKQCKKNFNTKYREYCT